MQALILAGGLGTRLRSVVSDRPKPMVAFANKPFLEYQIEFLKNQNIDEIILCIGYLHEQIQEYLGDGSKWGVRIEYSIEGELLGTAGAIKQAERFINGPFLVMNGDTYFFVHLSDLLEFHQQKKTENDIYFGSLALTKVERSDRYGSIQINETGQIVSFAEKSGESNLINAGIYILAPKVLELIPPAQKASLEKDVFPKVLEFGNGLFGHYLNGYFVDIGTPEGYQQFQDYIEG